MKQIFKYILILVIFCCINIEVNAATTFSMAECSEPNYIRKTLGSSDKLTDVDNEIILLQTNHKVEILETKEYNGENWYKIFTNYYSSNYTGYIKARYFKNKKDYTLDDNYINELKNKGFPESYAIPLAKLHVEYPNWNFEVSKYGEGLDFNTVISEEYNPVHKNLIQNSSDKSLWSTDPSVFVNGNYKVFENHWHAPTKQTISFYIDPRNWLNEKNIFMFEQLSYNTILHTINAVQSVLNGTFMAGNYTYNDKTVSYAETFIAAANEWKVSPIQLASRVIQEQGQSGNSSTINMDGGDGKLYYNFFNINASGENLVQKALATAKANGWDNPYKSIVDGAKLIANGYIAVGQDTLYYQKFNTISNTYGLYTNQYMANVRVLPSESLSIYNSYKSNNLLNNAFTFKIPVYLNMPTETTLSINGNGETNLNSLSVSGCSLSPVFYPGATYYTCNVNEGTNTVTVNATAASNYAVVTGSGNYELKENSTRVDIKVKAPSGEEKTYTVIVNKVSASDVNPADIVSFLGYNNNNNILSNIPLGENVINIDANIKSKYNLVNVEITNSKGEKKTSGIVATGDKLIITSGSGRTEFTLKIKADVSGDGIIDISDLAMIKAKLLNKRTLEGIKFNASDINEDGVIDISDLAMVKAHLLGKRVITK